MQASVLDMLSSFVNSNIFKTDNNAAGNWYLHMMSKHFN